jgi:hypothetical protein
MLKKVRDSGLAGWIVRRASAVPDHVRHHGHTVIRDHNNAQPVLKRKFACWLS